MLLVMLLLNLFMCSSMTCRCIKTEENEKEPSDYGDYDPYRADWTAPNSLHGSRYSLENARSGAPGGRIGGPGNAHHSGYTSTDETVNSETTSGQGGGGGGQDNDSYVPDRQYIHGDPAQQRMQQVSSQEFCSSIVNFNHFSLEPPPTTPVQQQQLFGG